MTHRCLVRAVLVGLAILVPFAAGLAGQRQRARIESQTRIVSGVPVGDVLVNGQTVIRLRGTLGAIDPAERARIVAGRLRDLDAQGRLRPEAVIAGTVDTTALLIVADVPVVTADSPSAREIDTTPLGLALAWRDNLRTALRGRVRGNGRSPTAVAQKVVPVISVGSGLRVGAALVAGERDRLDNTRAVAMIETDYRDVVRVRLLVPISIRSGLRDLDRVPGVAVIGVGDIEL